MFQEKSVPIKYPLSKDWYNVITKSRHEDEKLQKHCKRFTSKDKFTYNKKSFRYGISSYSGSYDPIGFTGKGTYTFFHGAVYEGEFLNGMMHGEGILTYPNGVQIKGTWIEDVLHSSAFYYEDGLRKKEPFKYCQEGNRKFHIENQLGLRAAGQEFLTNIQPTRKLPENCYDMSGSIYDPKMKCFITDIVTPKQTFDWKHQKEIIRKLDVIPNMKMHKWIQEKCRKAWEEPTGYRPEFYKFWNVGTRKETDAIKKALSS